METPGGLPGYSRRRLFAVASDAPCWQRTELFFSTVTDDQEHAKLICAGCTVRQECLLGAAERREPAGVWGGVCFPDEYRALRRLALHAERIAARAEAARQPARGEGHDGGTDPVPEVQPA